MRRATGGTVYRFMTHVVPGVVRPLRILWNQLIGFIFVVMATAAVPLIYRDVRHFTGDVDDVFRIAIAFIFMCVMLYFGITSFLRARRITRS